MAHGRPDFFGTPIHPKYGIGSYQTGLVGTINAGLDADIFNVTDKGRTYGGYLNLGKVTNGTLVTVQLNVDGTVIWGFDVENYRGRCWFYSDVDPIFMRLCDYDGGYAFFGFTRDFTFEKEYRVHVFNFSAVQITLAGILLYAKVAI